MHHLEPVTKSVWGKFNIKRNSRLHGFLWKQLIFTVEIHSTAVKVTASLICGFHGKIKLLRQPLGNYQKKYSS